jgi:hypothetical protein
MTIFLSMGAGDEIAVKHLLMEFYVSVWDCS